MQRSVERILTTHTGSLPRPDDLSEQLLARDRGEPYAEAALEARARGAVAEIVRRQVSAGLDVVNDGEQSKSSYATYVKDRLSGFERTASPAGDRPAPRDIADFPGLVAARGQRAGLAQAVRPTCTGPIAYHGEAALAQDIANLQAALAAAPATEGFMTAASPGVVAYFLPNQYYPDEEAYLGALAEAMRPEYEAIVAAGLLLQVDCPDLGSGGADSPSPEANWRRMEPRIEALNHAVANIPAERMRLHVCWGNYEGPHHYDVPLGDMIDVLWTARPAGLSFEAANPRHAHEWQIFEEVRLPEGKVLIPGMLDTTTNYIEHPDLIAQRIARYAALVGRENVIAGSDCGFATWAGPRRVDADVAWAKLAALAEGARRASRALWSGTAAP
jgi:5-methyltetrahydropteroyltriglutamate--homocysteine methyltransferase